MEEPFQALGVRPHLETSLCTCRGAILLLKENLCPAVFLRGGASFSSLSVVLCAEVDKGT